MEYNFAELFSRTTNYLVYTKNLENFLRQKYETKIKRNNYFNGTNDPSDGFYKEKVRPIFSHERYPCLVILSTGIVEYPWEQLEWPFNQQRLEVDGQDGYEVTPLLPTIHEEYKVLREKILHIQDVSKIPLLLDYHYKRFNGHRREGAYLFLDFIDKVANKMIEVGDVNLKSRATKIAKMKNWVNENRKNFIEENNLIFSPKKPKSTEKGSTKETKNPKLNLKKGHEKALYYAFEQLHDNKITNGSWEDIDDFLIKNVSGLENNKASTLIDEAEKKLNFNPKKGNRKTLYYVLKQLYNKKSITGSCPDIANFLIKKVTNFENSNAKYLANEITRTSPPALYRIIDIPKDLFPLDE